MLSLLQKIVRRIALSTGWLSGVYRRLCRPNGDEYAEFLRRHGSFHAIGEHCSILPETFISDPAYVRLGNNVRLSTCALIGHDGSIAMLNRRFGLRLDRVGKTDIRDNVFIGYGAIVMPGVTIGPDAIVAAGAVVTRDVGANQVVAGVPAKAIGKVDELARRLQQSTDELPWADLIHEREGHFDARVEPQLLAARVRHFYGDSSVAAVTEVTPPQNQSPMRRAA